MEEISRIIHPSYPHYLKLLGFQHHLSNLKINEYILAFVPFELSFTGCRLLLSLSPSEIDFFNAFSKKLSKLNIHLTCVTKETTVSTYIHGFFEKIVPLDSATNSCILTFRFKSHSATYRDALLSLCDKDAYFRSLFADEYYHQITFSDALIETLLDSADAVICYSNLQSGILRIVSLSINSLRCFGEFDLPTLKSEGVTKLIIQMEGRKIPLVCTLQKEEPSHEVEGFSFVDFSVEFNSSLMERIAGYLNQFEDSPRGNG